MHIFKKSNTSVMVNLKLSIRIFEHSVGDRGMLLDWRRRRLQVEVLPDICLLKKFLNMTKILFHLPFRRFWNIRSRYILGKIPFRG